MPAVSFHSDSAASLQVNPRLKYLKYDLPSKDLREDLRLSYLQEQKKPNKQNIKNDMSE